MIPRCEEERFVAGQALGLWQHIHKRKILLGSVPIYGFACVPPTPFLLKDWERYDVSRYVPPGCVSPEEGYRSVPVDPNEIKWGTIQLDLAMLAGEDSLDHAVFLFHTPPYDTPLDRAALDGKSYEHVALDLHVGSIAVRRFIEERQPLLTLHGHVHESARLNRAFGRSGWVGRRALMVLMMVLSWHLCVLTWSHPKLQHGICFSSGLMNPASAIYARDL